MLAFDQIDLSTDQGAQLFLKHEVVDVCFATAAGELISREGPNRYLTDDALITGSTGDRWSVSRARFDAKYEPVAPTQAGRDGRYQCQPIPVLAKQIHEPFSISRSAGGDLLRGATHDWLLQYAPGDFGIVKNSRFRRVYSLAPKV